MTGGTAMVFPNENQYITGFRKRCRARREDADCSIATASLRNNAMLRFSKTSHVQSAALDLIELHRLKQCLEISLAKAFVAFTLNEFKENRAELILAKYLQQQFIRCSVHQNVAAFEAFHIFAMAGDALGQ